MYLLDGVDSKYLHIRPSTSFSNAFLRIHSCKYCIYIHSLHYTAVKIILLSCKIRQQYTSETSLINQQLNNQSISRFNYFYPNYMNPTGTKTPTQHINKRQNAIAIYGEQ